MSTVKCDALVQEQSVLRRWVAGPSCTLRILRTERRNVPTSALSFQKEGCCLSPKFGKCCIHVASWIRTFQTEGSRWFKKKLSCALHYWTEACLCTATEVHSLCLLFGNTVTCCLIHWRRKKKTPPSGVSGNVGTTQCNFPLTFKLGEHPLLCNYNFHKAELCRFHFLLVKVC